MKECYKTPSAVIVLLTREHGNRTQVLLQRRQNTGFADGRWDFSCAGKVEDGETMTHAAVREINEELGITVKAEDLRFAVLVHKCDKPYNLVFYNTYFICKDFIGLPRICEPNKCSELKWFDVDNLPEDIISDRREAYRAFCRGEGYIEYGWE